MHIRLYAYLTKYNLLNPRQYGFKPKHSTSQAVIDFCISVVNAKHRKENVLAIMLDLSKAFDTIQHDILLNKLQYYGIQGKAFDWFTSYLSNRQQYVHINETTQSSLMNITGYGIPQGSVLGPLLFIIYVNDIHKALGNNNLIQFADDTTVYFTDSNIHKLCERANQGLTELTDWFRANKLAVNPKKTKYLLIPLGITTNLRLTHIKIGSEKIECSFNANFLGIHIDAKLGWEEHIKHCKNKISGGIYA